MSLTHSILIIVIVFQDVEISRPLLLRTIKNEHIFRGYFGHRDAPPMCLLCSSVKQEYIHIM